MWWVSEEGKWCQALSASWPLLLEVPESALAGLGRGRPRSRCLGAGQEPTVKLQPHPAGRDRVPGAVAGQGHLCQAQDGWTSKASLGVGAFLGLPPPRGPEGFPWPQVRILGGGELCALAQLPLGSSCWAKLWKSQLSSVRQAEPQSPAGPSPYTG